jgi:type III restriction enzyme
MTESGKAIIIEAKGDNLDNSDSETKLRLGRRWADEAGKSFRYFMVFQTKDIKIEGAYALDEFIGIVGQM